MIDETTAGGRTGAWCLFLVVAAWAGPSVPAAAQERQDEQSWLTASHVFAPLVADPREPRTSVTYLETDLLRSAAVHAERPEFEVPAEQLAGVSHQGTAAFGISLPVWESKLGSRARLEMAVQGGVFARFRLDTSTQDLLGTDWTAALPVSLRYGGFAARARLLHWSSHLGDEIAKKTSAVPITYSFEAAELLIAKEAYAGRLRVYGGGALILRSQTNVVTSAATELISNQAYVQLGTEGRWHPWLDGRFGFVGGVDVQRWDMTDWENHISASLGVEVLEERRRLGLVARVFDGPSRLGQFFLSSETFYGLELRVDL